MAVSQWFVRLAHAYVAALSAPGVEGQMYAVDMRLRPSGNKGPVAVSLDGQSFTFVGNAVSCKFAAGNNSGRTSRGSVAPRAAESKELTPACSPSRT